MNRAPTKAAQVDVQNRLARAEPRLPATVKQIGVKVEKAQSNFLMLVRKRGANPSLSSEDVSDYVSRNVLPELQRGSRCG